ncbi:MAG: exodeoxyribonuclease VII large subunit, partial [Gemmatimonadaceae bacterium]|nr:exodeoxyribonuclease VII large subunit [Gemmatimonadaceae bacterium]
MSVRDAGPGESPETAFPVAALTQMAKEVLEGAFPPLWIRGEVSGFKRYSSGHWYFTLKDATAHAEMIALTQASA